LVCHYVKKKFKLLERVEYAVESLKEFIIEGNLKPGTELPPESEKEILTSFLADRPSLSDAAGMQEASILTRPDATY